MAPDANTNECNVDCEDSKNSTVLTSDSGLETGKTNTYDGIMSMVAGNERLSDAEFEGFYNSIMDYRQDQRQIAEDRADVL